jgi:hypothetical protein
MLDVRDLKSQKNDDSLTFDRGITKITQFLIGFGARSSTVASFVRTVDTPTRALLPVVTSPARVDTDCEDQVR